LSALKERFGHEENLSKAIAGSPSFRALLNQCGVEITEKAIFETRVDLGHDGREGRIDIIQPTTSGVVIVEVQYGTSDGAHAERLQNYATNFRKPAFVIWIAESFRKDHVARFEQAKTPVLCARAKLSDGKLTLAKASPITWTKTSQAKRAIEAHKKYLELSKKLFSKSKDRHFEPMHRFFGAINQLTSAKRKKQRDDRMTKPRNKPIDFERNIEAIIDYYLCGLPKKSKFYLFKHPSFVELKETLKDEMACHWMIANLNNDHPYLDYAFLESIDTESFYFGRNRSDFKRPDHLTRKSHHMIKHCLTSSPWYDWDNHELGAPPEGMARNSMRLFEMNAWIRKWEEEWRPGIYIQNPGFKDFIPVDLAKKLEEDDPVRIDDSGNWSIDFDSSKLT